MATSKVRTVRAASRAATARTPPAPGAPAPPGAAHDEERAARAALEALDPLARAWFTARFPSGPTGAQRLAWPALARGANALLVAPTGSGKTLAAFLQPLGRLAHEALAREPDALSSEHCRTPDAGVRVLYVSPLRALDADVHHNLRAPLEGLAAGARAMGSPIAIEHMVRTGDTPARERRIAQKRPPHVLITTPESLFVLLGSDAHRRALARVELVIVDELHAIADNKRGTHLSLSLERLEALCPRPPQRVGLTATAEPLDELAAMLVGDPARRPVEVLDARHARAIELAVELAPRDRANPDAKGLDPRVNRAAALVARSERALVFVGSRMLAERVRPALERALEEREGGPHGTRVGVHHGALARDVRETVEQGLRDGSLRAVVATGSLELGIDVGAVDLVVQLGAPGGVARLLQRVGRAGHRPDAVARGVLVSSGGADLLECGLTAKLALEARLEPLRIPREPLDVLAQQWVAHVAALGDAGARLDAFLSMAQRAYPYRDLSRETLVRVTEALASGHLRAPRLQWDRATGVATAPDSARRLARTAGGAITSRGLYRLLDADTRETLGELDEEFVHESKPGDRFTFGLGVYRVVSIRADAVLAKRAPPGAARMPFWRGDRPPRAAATGRALGAAVRALEDESARRLDAGIPAREGDDEAPGDDEATRAVRAITEAARAMLPLRGLAAEGLAETLRAQRSATALPTDRVLVIERYDDALGEERIALHSWMGRSVLEPWALALAARLEARLGGVAYAVATDNGVLIAPPKGPPLDARALATLVRAHEIRAILSAIAPRTAIAGAAFREAAERALLLPRQPFKKRTPLWMNRQRARDLLLVVREDPQHPIVAEALREVLDDRWNTDALVDLLAALERNEITVAYHERRTPSPFARALETAFRAENLYDDDAPAGERLAHRASASADPMRGEGTFASPLELAGLAEPSDRGILAGLSPELPLMLLLSRARGPVTLEALGAHVSLDAATLRATVAPHVDRGELLVGYFTTHEPAAGDPPLEVCDVEALAWLRTKALARARRAVEPVSRRAYQRWVLERHGAGPYAADGDEAFTRALGALAMYPVPPEALERDLLRVRARRYEPALLDLACARGEVRYVLLEGPARVVLAPSTSTEPFPPSASRVAGEWAQRVRDALRERGALFFAELAQGTRLPIDDLSDVLAKMLRAGELTNDSFGPARALVHNTSATRATAAGRYALRPALLGEPSIDALIERMLARYGVVARPLVELEELSPAWGAMRDELDRREARGEVRRGEVVEGMGPVQFARTETIEALRASRSEIAHGAVLLSSRDPALVAEVPGLGRAASTRVIVRDGEALVVVERDGLTLRATRVLTHDEAHAAVEALRSLARVAAILRPFRALTVERIDERPASEPGVLADALVAQGFERDGARLVLASFRG